MPTHEFNRKRLKEVEELLDIQYEKLFELEKALETADGATQRVVIRQHIKREITPSLRQREQEYAELLAAGVQVESIPEEEADVIVAELVEATSNTEANTGSSAPGEMLELLQQIKQKLDEPGKTAAAKLKVALPIIPLISSYELELDTENFVTTVWRKAKGLFHRLISSSHQ